MEQLSDGVKMKLESPSQRSPKRCRKLLSLRKPVNKLTIFTRRLLHIELFALEAEPLMIEAHALVILEVDLFSNWEAGGCSEVLFLADFRTILKILVI